MHELAILHVAKPAPYQAIVGRRNIERSLQQHCPNIHEQRCADANDHCPQQDICFSVQDPTPHRRSLGDAEDHLPNVKRSE
jgi:hypothetical protein